jgi:hypothetical protein
MTTGVTRTVLSKEQIVIELSGRAPSEREQCGIFAHTKNFGDRNDVQVSGAI